MHSKRDNIEIICYDKADEVIKKTFESPLWKHQMKGVGFNFDWVNTLHYKCQKISLYCGGSHIGSSDWAKTKKSNKL